MSKEQEIEKARQKKVFNIGDTFTRHGITYKCTGFSANTGKPLWSKVKDGESGTQAPSQQPTKKTQSQASDDDGGSKQDTAPKQEQPKKAPYDAPTPKIEYKTKRPADGIVFEVPETWNVTNPSNGQLVKRTRKNTRKACADWDDDKLIKVLNNKNNSPYLRQICYEEAMARGIDESKINVSGTLQDKWDLLKEEAEMFNTSNETEVDEDEWETYDMSALRGMDPDKFVEENFDEGDDGWRYRDNEIIQKEFGRFKTLADRKRYDAFLDYMNRKDPYYRNPEQQMLGLNRLFATFLKGKAPLMVSAGGAGAGKTTGFQKVANVLGLVPFDSTKHKPGEGDYHYFMPGNDIVDDKDFAKLLHDHNGKIIVFDDKDRLLVSNANKLISMMKAISDGNPKMRLFTNPDTGQPERFTGKLLFITNKSMDTLNKDEDHKAIMSRGLKHDIRMTVNENMELLKKRYKTMGGQYFDDPAEDVEWREKVYGYIKQHKDKLDPDKFTVRKFTEIMEAIAGLAETNKMSEENEDAAEAFGSNVDWKMEAHQILNKAVVYSDFKKPYETFEGDKTEMLLVYKKNPKKFIEVFGEDFLDILNDDDKKGDNDGEIEESFMNDIGNMSIEEAESLLFQ